MSGYPSRISLAALPTPLQRLDRLSEAWGGPTLWVKRDDLTGFGLSGNKVRKLEYHLAAARESECDTLITCGATQSNHCRATALAAAIVGLDCHLVLRTPDPSSPPPPQGNHLLSALAGATIHFVSPEQYEVKDEVMSELATEVAGDGATPWVIPEGGSDMLGMWGFAMAMEELSGQLASVPIADPVVWHAASSGGTTAGLAWGADRLSHPARLVGSSVGEAVPQLRARLAAIWDQAGATEPSADLELIDDFVGEGYGVATPEELAIQADATALTGLIFDPTYTGKALYGLHQAVRAGRYGPSDHVVFWHTGGGFAVFAHEFGSVIGPVS